MKMIGMLGLGMLGILLGCVALAPPKTVYQDSAMLIQLREDRQGVREGFSHPASITADQLARVLEGLRVQRRRDPIIGVFAGQPDSAPAFRKEEIRSLAMQLSAALAAAGPKEMVTFYRRNSDAGTGIAITSGGMLVLGQTLYVILSNYRNRPWDAMNHTQAITSEIDPVDDPLMSLQPGSYALAFSPEDAVVKSAAGWQYMDPAKVISIDLAGLRGAAR